MSIRETLGDLHRVGLERDPFAAAVAHKRAACSVVVGSVETMPFGAERFSAIVSLDVLCHAGVPLDATIREFRRLLRPGGILFLSLPAYQWMLSSHDKAVSNARRFTLGELRRVLTGHGFKIERDGYWNSLLFPLMVMHRFLSRNSAESDVRPFPAWQNRLFHALLRIEAQLRVLGFALPFGGSVWTRCRRL
jgi:SAM-dependent methyltransferase